MRRIVSIWVALAVMLVLLPRDSSSAQAVSPDPLNFALTASDFPPDSQITDARVASNEEVAFLHLQIGPGLPAGRVTGYYMQARTHDSAGRLRLVTSYLVSIYSSSDGATAAFDSQADFWRSQRQASENALGPAIYGDPGKEHWYSLSSSGGNTHSELFFQRGTVFVEVNLDSFGSPATVSDTQVFLNVVAKLDSRAVRPITATPIPTATRTPTSTPRPTATSTPSPTATSAPTLAPVKPVKETTPCKKGWKRVKGKCKKARSK